MFVPMYKYFMDLSSILLESGQVERISIVCKYTHNIVF